MEGYIPFKKAAELEDADPNTLSVRARRQHIPLVNDPASGRSKLFPVNRLSEKAKKKLDRERSASAIQAIEPSLVRASLQRNLFPSPCEADDGSAPTVPIAIPHKLRGYAAMAEELWRVCMDGVWRSFEGKRLYPDVDIVIEKEGDRIASAAKHFGLGSSTAYGLLARMRSEWDANEGKTDQERLNAAILAALPKRRPGRRSIFSVPGNEWMFAFLRRAYLNEAKYSVKRAHEMLCEEIDGRQRAWRLGRAYEEPTLRQCRTALKSLPEAQKVLARFGEKAYNDRCAPYISRNPESLRSNDVWVTDQKQIDVRLRGAGEQLGRIWMVSFQDARSWKVTGYWFGPILSSDMVISAAATAIGRYGVPKAILMDLGKEFTCTAFSGAKPKIRMETVLREAQGLCQRLGIEVIRAIGRNPQTKPIERWHREAARFDHGVPGWCGGNTDERPEVLAEFERQHEEWKSTGRGRSPLWTIAQYLFEFVKWIEQTWNAKHRGRGKYLRGMTPDECWNTHLPEGGVQRVTATQLDLATADHRVLKVARGGQINITIHGQTIEYQAPELFLRQGSELEVILSRRSLQKITVLDRSSGGRLLCEAQAKPLFHWGLKAPEDREELRQAIRIRNAAKKAVSLGNAARRVLEVTATPIETAEQRRPPREISSMEFKSRGFRKLSAPRTQTTGELAREVFGKGDS